MKGYTVDVYFVLAGDFLPSNVIVDTDVDIIIDNAVVGNFKHNASQFSDYQYNQSIYSNSSMVNRELIISVKTAGNSQSVLLFDYLTYTCVWPHLSACPLMLTDCSEWIAILS